MPSQFICEHCDFDFGVLPERIELSLTASGKDAQCPVSGGQAGLRCPVCGQSVRLQVGKLGVIIRGTGANAAFAQWRSQPGTAPSGPLLVGRLEVRFDRFVSMDPREACFERVPVFRDETGTLRVPDLPLRPDMFDCLDVERTKAHLAKGPLSEVVGAMCRANLYLRGLDKPAILDLPLQTQAAGGVSAENAYGEVNLRVWPKLHIKGWRHFLVGAAGTTDVGEALIRDKRLLFSARGNTDGWSALDVAQRAGGSVVRSMTERPEWIALSVVDDTANVVAGGIFAVAGSGPVDPVGDAILGLDFGTSNTCVAFDDGSGTPDILPPVASANWNEYVLRCGDERSSHAGPDLWPSASGFGPKGDVFPSEILLPRTRQESVAYLAKLDSWLYGVDYGIPAAGVQPAYGEADRTVRYFKWAELVKMHGGSFADSKYLVGFQAQYLTAALMNSVLRTIAKLGQVPHQIDVRYGYPMAFCEDDLQTLQSAAEMAGQTLTALTGMAWNLTLGLDESAAAAKNAGAPSINVFVYIDMGGGSADIAVKLKRTANHEEAVFLTSVRYAGSALLDSFAGIEDPSSRRRVGSCLSQAATVDTLHRKVRECKKANDVLTDSVFNRAMANVVERRIACFYYYLTEYVSRLLASGLIEQRFGDPGQKLRFGVFLLGNGWGFATRLLAAGMYANLVCDRIFKRMLALIRQDETDPAMKLKAILKPSSLAFECGELEGPPHAKAAVAYGQLRGQVQGSSKGTYGCRSGSLGVTTKIGNSIVPWYARYSTVPGGPPGQSSDRSYVPSDSWDDPGEHSYYKPWPIDSILDWPAAEPAWPDDLPGPLTLDERLNRTRGHLRDACSLKNNAGWFAQGPYEVMLEKLFRPKLGGIT